MKKKVERKFYTVLKVDGIIENELTHDVPGGFFDTPYGRGSLIARSHTSDANC